MWRRKPVIQPPIDPKVLELIERYQESAGKRLAAKDRRVLLFERDWGLPSGQVPTAVAKEHNMVMFSRKWVTREECKILEKESRSYKVIRSMGWSLIVGGVIYAGVGVLALAGGSGKEAYLLGSIVLLAIAGLICGVGILEVKRWAAYTATLVLAAGMVIPAILASEIHSPALMDSLAKAVGPVFLGLCMCINFFLPTGRKIFRAGRSPDVDW